MFLVPIGIQPEQVTIPDNDGASCERVGDDIASTCVSEKPRIHRHEAAYHHKRHLTRPSAHCGTTGFLELANGQGLTFLAME